MTRHVGVWIVDELSAEFSGAVPAAAIKACVEGAIDDLRGSTTGEALPEMAARLARVRLSSMAAANAKKRPGRNRDTAWAKVRDRADAHNGRAARGNGRMPLRHHDLGPAKAGSSAQVPRRPTLEGESVKT